MAFPVVKAVEVETAIEWYEHFLGFTCVYRNNISDAKFAVIEKDNLKIFIRFNETNSLDKDSLVIEVNDLAEAYSDCDSKGVIFTSGIEQSHFGGQQFTIKDYDHNKIIFKDGA